MAIERRQLCVLCVKRISVLNEDNQISHECTDAIALATPGPQGGVLATARRTPHTAYRIPHTNCTTFSDKQTLRPQNSRSFMKKIDKHNIVCAIVIKFKHRDFDHVMYKLPLPDNDMLISIKSSIYPVTKY